MLRGLALALLMAQPVAAEGIASARYEAPTDRYGHGALAGGEWAELVLVLEGGAERRFALPGDMVFEDVAPHLADLTGDGVVAAVVVESQIAQGTRLAIWGPEGRIDAGPFIGTTHRWLAPLGAADLNGDGRQEFAFVVRPHLDAVLSVARFGPAGFEVLAEAAGLPSHKLASPLLEGGVIDCAGRAMLLTADARWRNVVLSRLEGGGLVHEVLGAYDGPQSFAATAAAMGCDFRAP